MRIPFVPAAVLVALAFAACSAAKGPAEKEVKLAEEALSAVKVESMKYVPERFRGMEGELSAAKERLSRGDYAGAASAARSVAARAKELDSAAVARKAEMRKGWEEMGAAMPKTIADIRSNIAYLSRIRRLPPGMDRAKLEGARRGFDEVVRMWDEANRAYGEGRLADAFAGGEAAREKAAEIMPALGMRVPRTVKGRE